MQEVIFYQDKVYFRIPGCGDRRMWGRGKDTLEYHANGRWTLEVWPDNEDRAYTREIGDPR